jgi:hypothetical protein
MVLQERVFFRNIPMSTWSEREMLIEQSPANGLSPRPENLEPPVLTAAVPPAQATPSRLPVSKAPVPANSAVTPAVVSQVAAAPAPSPRRETRSLMAAHAAFGAQ